MAETPEQKYNRISAAVQQTILNSFPNPDRVGCPGNARVREVAARGTILEDDDWQHITHCSECYREFLAAKEETRRAGRKARTLRLIGGAALVILAAVAGFQYFGASGSRREIIAVAFQPATLNLRDSSTVRGDGKTSTTATPSLSREALELTVILPFGSEAGVYQFEIIDAAGTVLKSGEANAALRDGDAAFMTKIDLGTVMPGQYQFGLRRPSFNWVLTPVKVN